MSRLTLGTVFLAVMAVAPALAAGQTLVTGWAPETSSVARNTEFVVEFWVTQAGHPFNAFDATFGYDPAVLTFVQAVPVGTQQGTYMTSACGNTFHVFHAAGDSLTASVSLLCSGVSLTGPGQLYRLRFRSRDTSAVTTVSVRQLEFYDAGLFARPNASHAATIRVDAPNVDAPPLTSADGAVGVLPNPARGRVAFVASARAHWRSARVVDGAGRLVRCLALDPARDRNAVWDGADARGRRAAPGRYWVEFVSPGRRESAGFVLVR